MSLLNSTRPAATTETTLYTVPSAYKAVVNIYATNVSGTIDAQIRVGVQSSVGAFAAKDYIVYDLSLAQNEYWERTGIALTSNQSIRVYTDVATVNFHCNGLEESV